MAANAVHLISKDNTSEHCVQTTSTSSFAALSAGYVRARALLVGLTSNNMAYATNGSRMFWWDTFPVPADLSAPFNDQNKYGIVPVWGYGEVLESEVDGIDSGRLVWGFWPSSELPFDLKLKRAGVDGHFIEVSEHRGNVMNLYQRYILADPGLTAASLKDKTTFEKLATTAHTGAVWEAGYLLNNAIFGQPAIHPLGAGDWSAQTADLSSAVVMSLSGSGRTARSFTDNIYHERQARTGPLAFLAITSNLNADVFRDPPIPTKIVPYGDMTAAGTFDWISKQNPKKLVVVDLGGRDNAFDALFAALEKTFPDKDVMAIGCGAEAKAHDAEYLRAFAKRNELPNRTMMNTTGIRDAMMAAQGDGQYFREMGEAWRRYLERGCVSDYRLDVGRGIAGEKGFEGGWGELCAGRLGPEGARVYVL